MGQEKGQRGKGKRGQGEEWREQKDMERGAE